MDFSDFLRWEQTAKKAVYVKLIYFDMAEDTDAGVLLARIIYWHLPDDDGKTRLRVDKHGHLWIAKQRHEWWDECRLSQRQIDNAVKKLSALHLIQSRRFQFGAHRLPIPHIRLLHEEFMARFEYFLHHPPTNPGIPDEIPPNMDPDFGDETGINPRITDPSFPNYQNVIRELPKRNTGGFDLKAGSGNNESVIPVLPNGNSDSLLQDRTLQSGESPARDPAVLVIPPPPRGLALVVSDPNAQPNHFLNAMQQMLGGPLTEQQANLYGQQILRMLEVASEAELLRCYALKIAEKKKRNTWYRFEWLEKDLVHLLPLVRDALPAPDQPTSLERTIATEEAAAAALQARYAHRRTGGKP